MAMLDLTIANASLKDIQGSLSASLDEGTWVSSAYLVGEIVVVPLAGWLAQVFSPRRFLISCAVLFAIFSILCGISHSLAMMVVARFFQGVAGGVMIPLATACVFTNLPLSQQANGLYCFTLVTVIAPSLGPFIGGWLTVKFSWRLGFFINIVPGIAMISMIYYGYKSSSKNLRLLKECDWVGIVTLVISLGTLTFVLEEGNRHDWLGNELIRSLSIISVISFSIFLLG